MGAGDLARSVELTSPELADRLSFSGTPDEVTAKIKAELEGTGVNLHRRDHGRLPGQGVHGTNGRRSGHRRGAMTLLAEEVMPHFPERAAPVSA